MDGSEMENEIEAGGFLEHGQYGEHLYGTKFESVRRVLQSGKMCVLDIEPTVSVCIDQFDKFFVCSFRR
jgi:guanylate kinase